MGTVAQDYAAIYASIKKQGVKMGPEDGVFMVLDVVASSLLAVSGAQVTMVGSAQVGIPSLANSAAQATFTTGKTLFRGGGVCPNPWFVNNGIGEDDTNQISIAYQRSRTLKGLGSAALNISGEVLGTQTAGINVIGQMQHLNAGGSTIKHMMQLAKIAEAYPQTRTIQRWIEVVMNAKMAKLSLRTTQFAAGFIPCASLPAGIMTAVMTAGIKLSMMNICYMTAASIHWRAYQEQKLFRAMGGGSKTNKAGPATRIYWEIFTRRGLTGVFGKYEREKLISEPGGWMPLADKLLLF